jgi:hypothetical protein
VDSQSIDTLLNSLKTMKKEDTVDEAGSQKADFGLLSPSATLAFSPVSGSAKSIQFGSDNPSGQNSYAQVAGEAPIFMVMRYSKTNVVKEAKDLRDKKVLDFQPSEVRKVTSNFGKGLALEMAKDGSWAIRAPLFDIGKESSITSWLQQLTGLRIDSFVDEDGRNPGKYGLGVGAARLEISLNNNPKPLVLLRGKKLVGSAKGSYYQIQGKPLIFSMADYASSTLEKNATDLVDKDAFSFSSFDVARFEIQRGGKVLKALKKDNTWAWDPPRQKAAGEADFDFFSFLSGISTATLKARLPKDTKIASPSLVATFYNDRDVVMEKVTLGGKGKTGLIALSQAKSQAVEIQDDLFSKLPQ